MREKLTRFMAGRYGVDQLNKFILIVVMVMIIGSLFTRSVVLNYGGLFLLIYAYYRMLSRNITKRYEENEKYLRFTGKITGWFHREKNIMNQRKEYHIYTCPQCKQKIRVPKGKGKIEVTCPKCKNTFNKKS